MGVGEARVRWWGGDGKVAEGRESDVPVRRRRRMEVGRVGQKGGVRERERKKGIRPVCVFFLCLLYFSFFSRN